MCNACGFLCCGSDLFEGCGCDCPYQECWDIEEDDYEGDDDDYEFAVCCHRPSRFKCEEVERDFQLTAGLAF